MSLKKMTFHFSCNSYCSAVLLPFPPKERETGNDIIRAGAMAHEKSPGTGIGVEEISWLTKEV